MVTGGCGFLGRVVTRELLARGYDVDVLTRGSDGGVEGAGTVRADLREAMGPIAGKYDAIAHLAAPPSARESFVDPLTFFDVIVGGTRNLLAAAGGQPRIVFASTNAVYGSAHDGRLSEDRSTHPESPYAAAKLAAEQIVDGYDAVTLRIFNIAGPYDTDPTRILPRILTAAADGQPIAVNGDGIAVRDFVHVRDVAVAVVRSLEGPKGIYNIGTGEGVSVIDLIQAVERITGRTVEVQHNPPKPEPHSLIADITKARSALGWRPEFSALERIVSDAWKARG
ncbi:NAD-dependent epimerase/dehydratase family protein [Fodinicola feengrottensis]|uniref:NAD-dependent epimerase/dehydratase family protein n=1 Tax=Fodinicola feengrottensis TaxID=435914 RepID=UPI0013D095E1|nr:NAD-dependent epimerase/dehydratase family protein [Fodinicola feengrottensis]